MEFVLREAVQLTGIEFWEDAVTGEQRDAASTLLVQCDLQSLCDDIFARVVQTREEDYEALFCSWWVALPKGFYNSTVRITIENRRNVRE